MRKGKWHWIAGCLACDTIERLNILLRGGVKIVDNQSPEGIQMRKRIEKLEAEVESLQEELLRSRMETRRAEHSAMAARASAERVRESCRYATLAGDDWN
jgi:hypothetical protein